jgi:Protein of unknown function (DUF1479)
MGKIRRHKNQVFVYVVCNGIPDIALAVIVQRQGKFIFGMVVPFEWNARQPPAVSLLGARSAYPADMAEPHKETTMALKIDDLPAAIRQAKQELRERLPNYRDVFAEVDEAIRAEASRIAEQRNRGEDVIPEIQFSDIAEQRVTAEQIELVKTRGACVIRNVFDRPLVGSAARRLACARGSSQARVECGTRHADENLAHVRARVRPDEGQIAEIVVLQRNGKALRNLHVVEIDFALGQRALSDLVQRFAARNAWQIERNDHVHAIGERALLAARS